MTHPIPLRFWLVRGVGVIVLLLFASRTPELESAEQVTLRIRFGLKDQEPTDWSGRLISETATIEAIRGWRWSDTDAAAGSSWTVGTRRALPQGVADRKRVAAGIPMPVTDNGVIVTLTGVNADESLSFETKPAKATFRLNQLHLGRGLQLADGAVVVERVQSVGIVSATREDEDYPAIASAADGTIDAVYLAFRRGRDFQGHRERVATRKSGPVTILDTPVRTISEPGDLAYLAQPAGGEQLYLRIFRDNVWSRPIPVVDGQRELYRPAVAVAGDGRVWVSYSEHHNTDKNLGYGNWELMARSFAADGTLPGPPINVSGAPGTDFMPAAATDSHGDVYHQRSQPLTRF